MDDNEIVELYWSRSETAISETAAKYSKYCRHIAFNILFNTEDADECVNDTYFRAWNAIPPARPSRLSTYLGKITRNLALSKYQKFKAAKRGAGQIEFVLSELEDCISDAMTPEQIVEDGLITQTLNSFLERLDKNSRMVFVRRYWYLSSIEEISGDYDMSVSKVKSILFRLRKKLRSNLEKEGISL